MAFNLAVANSDASRNQSAQAFWSLSADPLFGIDSDARFDAGMVGSPLLGPTPQGVDIIIGQDGSATVRGSVAGVNVGYGRAAPPAAAPVLRLPQTPQGWLILGAIAFLILRK